MISPKFIRNIKTLTGHKGAIYDIILFNQNVFTSSADKYIAQWNLETETQTGFSVKLEHSSYNIAFSDSSNLLAIGTNNGGIHVVDLVKKEEIKLLSQHKSSVFSVTYCPIRKQFYSGDREGYFCAWDAEHFEFLITLPFECEKIREISISEDGEWIAVCGQDGYIRILDSHYFNVINEFKAHEDGANCAVFDGDILYTGGKDAHIKKWNWREGKLLKSVPGHNYAVYDIELLDNKKKLVTVSFDKSIKLWNTDDISIIERIEYKNGGHRHTVNRIAKISENSFITVGDDRQIKVWELK